MKNTFESINNKRVAGVIAFFVCLGLFIFLWVINEGSLLPGLNPDAEARKHSIAVKLAKDDTVEGTFYDRNHNPITESGEAGEPAAVLYGEAFSYLIGYNSAFYGTSGLRSVLYDSIFWGGRDNIGASVNLTIDAELQQFCYKALGQHEGSVTVMNAKTGEILACASRSDDNVGYNVNCIRENFGSYNGLPAFFLNRAVMSNDPPGSTFKLITASSMIENNCSDFKLPAEATDEYAIGNYVIHNFGGSSYPEGTGLNIAFPESINTYFACVAVNALGAGKLNKTARSFLLGEDIDLDFASLHSNWDLGNFDDPALLAQTAYGQGNTVVSPLHIAMIMATVLNDGDMMKPYMVAYTENDGKVREYSTSEVLKEDVISKKTAREMQELLAKTAEHYGFDASRLGACYAKTGTAQVGEINGRDVHHIYIVCGVKAHDDNTYVAIMDWCRTFESSGVLKQPMAGLIEYISNHDFAPEVICKVDE